MEIEALTRSVSCTQPMGYYQRHICEAGPRIPEAVSPKGGYIMLVCTHDITVSDTWLHHGQATSFPVLSTGTLDVSNTGGNY